MRSLLIFIAIIPVVLLLKYINNKDVNKEPKKMLTILFILGAISIIPTAIIESIVKDIVNTNVNIYIDIFLKVLIEIALVEEGMKWIITRIISFNNKEFDERYDGVVYAVFVSMGFACVENILYVSTGGLFTGIFRAITSIPGHCCFGIIMGYYLAKAKDYKNNNNNNKSIYYQLMSLMLAIIAHTLYDYFIFLGATILNLILFGIWYLILLIIGFKMVKELSNNIKKTCPNCHQETNGGNYCSNCGYKLK